MATMPANCLHQSPTSLGIKILSKRRRKRSALPFVPCNVAFKLQAEADVVEPFKKQLFAELVYLKVHLPAASNHKLSCKVDLDFKVVVFEQIVDFLAGVKRGIYAKKFGGGQVDISNGDFVFSLTESYLIEDGKLTAPLKGVTLIGNSPFLKQLL